MQKQSVPAHSLDKPLETCQDQQNNRREVQFLSFTFYQTSDKIGLFLVLNDYKSLLAAYCG